MPNIISSLNFFLPDLRRALLGFCSTLIKLDLMPYFPRIKEMDRVGFEPTSSTSSYDPL
ncbi:MAG TPA: hypothetical protein VE544_10770 [Nitrososphaeraceae archaeon]|nr:hypothetical protein [Nitrososphaeraceae archaeon]